MFIQTNVHTNFCSGVVVWELLSGRFENVLVLASKLNVVNLFMISMTGVDYRSCTKQMACSEQCVRQYLARYASKCTGGRAPTCEDYARVHNGGPEGCRHSDTLSYWQRVERCCGSDCSSSSSSSDLDWRSSSSKVADSVLMQMVLPVKLTKMFAISKKDEAADSNHQWLSALMHNVP